MEGTIPKMWPGATCYILGGGPSLINTDFDIIKRKRTIVTNNAYELAPWSEVLFFMDNHWFKQHEKRLASYHGIKVTIANQFKDRPGIKFLNRGSKTMLSTAPNMVNNGNNSGYAAINLAFLLGASKIILVGFDMKVVDAQHNYHNEHTRKMKDNIYDKEYIPNFGSLVDPLAKAGIEILNATPDSALKCFPFVKLEDTINL